MDPGRRAADPFDQAARSWGAREAERRAERARREREAIVFVGQRPILGDDGASVEPTVEDPALALFRRGQLSSVPEHVFPLRGMIEGEEPPPSSPPPRSPLVDPWVSPGDRERTLGALVRRAEQAREEGRRVASAGSRRVPEQDAAHAAAEQERRRRSRDRYEAGRPSGEAEAGRAGSDPGFGGSRLGVPCRSRVELRGPSRAEIERDVGVVSAVPSRDPASRDRDQSRLRALGRGPSASDMEREIAEATHGATSETKSDVLAELNRRYGIDVEDPYRMLAYLRRVADHLAATGQRSSDRFRRVSAEHDRLWRASDDLV